MGDKLIIVYQGTIAQYRGDWVKDEYINKLVLVTGDPNAVSEVGLASYLCVSNGEKSVEIPIPAIYVRGVKINGLQYGSKDNLIHFAEANGISIKFDDGAVTIGISEELESQISQIETNVTSLDEHIDEVESKADNALTQLSGVVGDVQTAKATADDAKSIAQQAKDKANTNEKNITSIGGNVKTLENTISTLNGNINTAAKKANDAYSLAETASKDANTANNTITGVSNIVSSLRTTVEGHTSEIANIEGDVAENKAKIEAIEEDYISKGEAVDFATDLTGVVEATAEEFVYRPSAGEKSIRDKSAVIRRIKGNTSVWGQLAFPSNYSSGGLQFKYNNDGTIELNGAVTSAVHIGKVDNINAHKYLSICEVLSMGNMEQFSFGNLNNYYERALFTGVGVKYLFQEGGAAKTNYIGIANVDIGATMSNVILRYQRFDLTGIFGVGNEPTTYEEFRKVYNEAYYPYCQPELRGVKTGAIKTVGFNLFDGECARVIGGMSYIVSNYTLAYYSDTKDGTQTKVSIKGGVYTPECSGYLHLTGTADATPCVHFQHSGVMDNKCAPYVAHVLELPEILKLFPNGMHAVGDVFDEINIDTYIQRCEYRDYVEGDESNAEVLTDGKHTVAKLAEPIVKVLPEPITLDYYCEDWGSEEAIPASSASAPFRADIVYQFNAEGRIRDNSRNIEKLEKIVTPLKNIPSRASLATQDFVYAHIPTRVATATERVVVTVGDEKQNLLPNGDEVQYLLPNMLYDYGATSYDKIELPNLLRGDVAFNNKWMVRFASRSSDAISIPFDVFWKDGIAPSWSMWHVCEMTFFKDAEGLYTFGEWKIYK